MNRSDNMITLKDVSYSITECGRERFLLKDVTGSFKRGKTTIISGPSGSGKTTLLYAIAGLLDHVSGSIYIGDTDMNSLSRRERNQYRLSHMSMVFQNLNLFSFMNVEDNILVPLYLNEKKADEGVRKEVSRFLDLMQLGQIQNRPIQSLSGGEQQRVAIIRALIARPEVILCDEPTASLDSENVDLFMDTLGQISKETKSTFIIVTHDSRVFCRGEERITIVDGELYEKADEMADWKRGDKRRECVV